MPSSPRAPSDTPSSVLHRSLLRSYPVALRGEGVYVWDASGHRYLDLSGSAAVSLIGHGNPLVREAMAAQAGKLEFVHSSQFTTEAAERLAYELLEFAGEAYRGGAVYFTSGGSEAVETALKLARQYQVETGQSSRFRVLSRLQSYHGSTLGALAVSGNPRRRQIYGPMIRDCEQVATPYCYRCKYECRDCARQYAGELEQQLKTHVKEAAAFIFEPISGATLGAALPPDGYLKSVADTCTQNDVILIADEVMTGCGRTGRNFAVDHWKVTPDILVCGKSLASGYAPLGAIIAKRKVVAALARGSGAFVHGFTYNAHPISVAAGGAVLARIRELELVRAADSENGTAGSALREALTSLRDRGSVGDVRGRGLLWGVEFVADPSKKAPFPPDLQFSARVAEAAIHRGLLVYPMQGCVDGLSGDHLLVAPPATITSSEIAWAVEQLRAAIADTERQVEAR